ncbi:MAG: hypothetical protein AAFX58_09050, partial [Pseudomonadota bacterium]
MTRVADALAPVHSTPPGAGRQDEADPARKTPSKMRATLTLDLAHGGGRLDQQPDTALSGRIVHSV